MLDKGTLREHLLEDRSTGFVLDCNNRVVKVVPTDAPECDSERRFVREVLPREGFVTVLAHADATPRHFAYMMPNLGNKNADNSPAEPSAAKAWCAVKDAICKLAVERGVFYCDVKGDNVMLSPVPVVVDFGSCLWTQTAPRIDVQGMARFMPPEWKGRDEEVIRVEPVVSWGLGSLLRRMLNVANEAPDRQTERMLERCSQKKPEDRPTLRELLSFRCTGT